NEPEGRASCVHEAAPLLAQLPDTTLRVQIEREFAREVLLTPEELAERIAAVPRKNAQASATAPFSAALPQGAAPSSTPGYSGAGHEAGFDEPAGLMEGPDDFYAVPDDYGFPGDELYAPASELSRGEPGRSGKRAGSAPKRGSV